jgi:hypothetical protein
MKYVREIFDMIFSGYTFILLLGVVFIYLILQISEAEDRNRELRQKQIGYCYSQNMIMVETDAGRHCAPASSLTAIK